MRVVQLLSKHSHHFTLMGAMFAVLGLAGCAQDDTQSPGTSDPPNAIQTETRSLGQFRAHVNVRSGEINWEEVTANASKSSNGPTVGTQGFTAGPSGFLSFGTIQCQYGDGSDTSTLCDTGIATIAGCGATEFCATITAQNYYTTTTGQDLAVDTVWVTVSSIYDISPDTAAVYITNGDTDTLSLQHEPPLDTSLGGYNYGTLTEQQTSSAKTWKFETEGADNFTFDVLAWGTFRRWSYTASTLSTPGSFPDACADGGTIIESMKGTDATNSTSIDLPFVYTDYAQTFSTIKVNSNGFAYFPGSTPTNTNNNVNLSLAAAVPGIYPFWDNLTVSTCGAGVACGICYLTSGDAPDRTFDITWTDATIVSTGEKLSFTMRLYEGSDNVDFYYETAVGSPSDTLKGKSASMGLKGKDKSGNTKSVQIKGSNNFGSTTPPLQSFPGLFTLTASTTQTPPP